MFIPDLGQDISRLSGLIVMIKAHVNGYYARHLFLVGKYLFEKQDQIHCNPLYNPVGFY